MQINISHILSSKVCSERNPDSRQSSNQNKPFFKGKTQTSRERPKSAPYLRLKKTRKRKPLFLQLETTKALKKLKIDKKNFRNFFRNFFEVSGKSHSAKKCKKGGRFGIF